MQPTKEIKSIRRSILLAVVGYVCVFVLLACLYIAKTFLDDSKRQASQNIMQWAQYVAKISTKDLVDDRFVSLQTKLQTFEVNASIQKIDVYKYKDNQGLVSFFSGYDHLKSARNSGDTISDSEKEKYLTPAFENDIVKFVTPIIREGEKIGYVYIEINSHSGLSLDNQLFIIFIGLFFILVATAFFVSIRLENVVTGPLSQLRDEILKVSQTKDYSLRLTPARYSEADVLGRNINNFLNRTERHVTQLGLAEQQSLKLTIELEDKVAKRTEALKESNQELLSTLEKLHQFQDQLVESEKMASLGDMVAGVAHEVNTPIGLGVTASTLLSDRLRDIKLAFEDKTLKSSQLKKFLDEGDENVGIIYRNLKRAAELISSFKKVAVDQSSEEFRQFLFAELLNEILLTLAPQIKNTPYNISFDCPDDLFIVSKPGPINQIMINLILNSITHGFEGRDSGNINLNISRHNDSLLIVYTDDGKGIDPSIRDKVFDPFITTKRGEGGSGLGLHLVYNLVTQALGGNIKLDSEPEKGVTFEISFPISEQLL